MFQYMLTYPAYSRSGYVIDIVARLDVHSWLTRVLSARQVQNGFEVPSHLKPIINRTVVQRGLTPSEKDTFVCCLCLSNGIDLSERERERVWLLNSVEFCLT